MPTYFYRRTLTILHGMGEYKAFESLRWPFSPDKMWFLPPIYRSPPAVQRFACFPAVIAILVVCILLVFSHINLVNAGKVLIDSPMDTPFRSDGANKGLAPGWTRNCYGKNTVDFLPGKPRGVPTGCAKAMPRKKSSATHMKAARFSSTIHFRSKRASITGSPFGRGQAVRPAT